MYESEVGNPSKLVSKQHKQASSLQNRVVGAVENLRQHGARYDHDLEQRCISVIEQVKNVNPRYLPIGEWREWRVEDRVTLIVRMRRLS
jgi:hypothetical protein